MIQNFEGLQARISRSVSSDCEEACDAQTPVVRQMSAIQSELSCMDGLISMLYERLGPVTVFALTGEEKDDGDKRPMCDLEAALHARVLDLRYNNRKLHTLIDAIQI